MDAINLVSVALRILSLPIILHYKSFLFEQLNRTIVSRKKLIRFGIIENANCPKCNVESTTEHAIFSCYFSKYFIHTFALFLDNMYNYFGKQRGGGVSPNPAGLF